MNSIDDNRVLRHLFLSIDLLKIQLEFFMLYSERKSSNLFGVVNKRFQAILNNPTFKYQAISYL